MFPPRRPEFLENLELYKKRIQDQKYPQDTNPVILDKLREEVEELNNAVRNTPPESYAIKEEFGDVLLTAFLIADKLNIDFSECICISMQKMLTRFFIASKIAQNEGFDFQQLSYEKKHEYFLRAKRALVDSSYFMANTTPNSKVDS